MSGSSSESKRFYPNRELAAHLLGHVGKDHEGLDGIEHTYDTVIKGHTGTLLVQKDSRGSTFSNKITTAPTAGATLELTIDEYLQYVVERELSAGVVENRAASGSAIVMDPWTGEILALANVPTFNPNARQQARPEMLRNRAVQDIYEPGSTFKIVTASAALEQKIVDPDDRIDVSGGKINFGSDVIRDTHDYRVLTFEDVIVKSSNVGAIKVALKLGAVRLTDYVKRFGFGRRSAPRDFPAESPGKVWEASKLKESALARVSIGYQVAVTPLQMAAAVSSIANGGELIQPRVVQAIIKDGTRRTMPKTVVNRTVTPSVAAQVTAIMEGVVQTWHGYLRPDPGVHDRRQDGHGDEVGGRALRQVRAQCLLRRIRAVAEARLYDRRRRRFPSRAERLLRRSGLGTDFQADCRSSPSIRRGAAHDQRASAAARPARAIGCARASRVWPDLAAADGGAEHHEQFGRLRPGHDRPERPRSARCSVPPWSRGSFARYGFRARAATSSRNSNRIRHDR